jgi:hypothetical protein
MGWKGMYQEMLSQKGRWVQALLPTRGISWRLHCTEVAGVSPRKRCGWVLAGVSRSLKSLTRGEICKFGPGTYLSINIGKIFLYIYSE